MLPKSIKNELRCPCCLSGLGFFDNYLKCENDDCGVEFPIVNGVPVLINESNSIFDIESFLPKEEHLEKKFEKKIIYKIIGVLNKITPNLGNNHTDKGICERLSSRLTALSSAPRVLVVGGGEGGGGIHILENNPSITLIESDVRISSRTDLVCDCNNIPFETASFDAVIIQAVLEHVVNPDGCVREIYRVLKPDGLVYSETPFMQQVHGREYDFTRYSYLGHRRLFRNFEEVESGASCGPGMVLAWSYKYFLLSFFKSKLLRLLVSYFAAYTSFFWKYFDRMVISKPGAYDSASSYYFVGKKSKYVLSDRQLIKLYKGAF